MTAHKAGDIEVIFRLKANEVRYGVPDPEKHYWRTGRRVGRTIYCVLDRDQKPSEDDPLIGTMDTPELAMEAVRVHNDDIDARNAR